MAHPFFTTGGGLSRQKHRIDSDSEDGEGAEEHNPELSGKPPRECNFKIYFN